mmetsp:Transcript_2628/g.6335  ORF Transcript_2628/g.6335 Transcript_2628/m.6335 type:complete len:208 (-) Transcript_2628:1096-1719(-)
MAPSVPTTSGATASTPPVGEGRSLARSGRAASGFPTVARLDVPRATVGPRRTVGQIPTRLTDVGRVPRPLSTTQSCARSTARPPQAPPPTSTSTTHGAPPGRRPCSTRVGWRAGSHISKRGRPSIRRRSTPPRGCMGQCCRQHHRVPCGRRVTWSRQRSRSAPTTAAATASGCARSVTTSPRSASARSRSHSSPDSRRSDGRMGPSS